MVSVLTYLVIGLAGGIAAGLFGIGGGVVIVPLLIYWAGFPTQRATGTSLAVLLPPIGLAAALEYYRHGNVDVRGAIFIAVAMFVGAWFGAFAANKMGGAWLRLAFGAFVIALGIDLIRSAGQSLGWFR